jgi:hypothetical protein
MYTDKLSNKVLAFIHKVHRFEQQNKLFELRDEAGLLYWDIVRSKVFQVLFEKLHAPSAGNTSNVTDSSKEGRWSLISILKFILWWIINDVNFRIHSKNKKWVILKVSRFYDEAKRRPSDAVMDEVESTLPDGDKFVLEAFNNTHFGPITLGKSPFFHYKVYYLKKMALRRLRQRTFPITRLLDDEFGVEANWDDIINNELSDFRVDYSVGMKIFKRTQAKGFLFTGNQKGLVYAARKAGVTAIEVQHSPLNSADIYYSYPSEIDYSLILSLPQFLLVNSALWSDFIFYPARFINVGSNYFFRSSEEKPNRAKNHLLIISDPVNFRFLLRFIEESVRENNLLDQIIFKLHSAEADHIELAKRTLAPFPNIKVVYNEKNISELMNDAFAVVIIYSTVAYQAIQLGLAVIILTVGYFEGGYDLFKLPNTFLVNANTPLSSELIASIKQRIFPKSYFFEPLDEVALQTFLSKF